VSERRKMQMENRENALFSDRKEKGGGGGEGGGMTIRSDIGLREGQRR
jgi:hypothetical protein